VEVFVTLKRETLILASFGAFLEASILIVYYFTGLSRTTTLLEPFFAIPFAIYLACIVWVMRSTKGSSDFGTSTMVIIAISVVLYFTFLLQTPTLSGDIYRYIWDGKLVNNGISPYRYPPDASQLNYLHDANWQLVENKNIISPYPPLLELINALTYRVSPSVSAFKGATIVAAIGTVAVLPYMLRKINYDPRLAILFAWNPLFILEFGSSGHDDTIALLFVSLSIYFLLGNKRIPSAAMMALGVVSKLFPLLIIPIFLKRWGAKGTVVLVAIIIGLYTPFFFLGGSVVNTLSVYVLSSTPIFNAGIFALFQNLFTNFGANGALFASRVIEYSVFGGVLIYMLWMILRRNLEDMQLIRYAGILLSVYLIFSSTIEPWYVSWLFVPFLVMMPTWSWILFSGTVFLTYLTYTQTPISTGYWPEILWVKIVEFAPLYGMIAYELATRNYFVAFLRRREPKIG
jgi:alpha-1,6-mannosyltransferase